MPLSEYESRVLEQLEQEFSLTDPELARWLATGVAAVAPPPPPAARRLSRLRPRLALPPLALPRLALPRLAALAMALMSLGAILLAVAAVWGWVALFAVAGAVYLAGLLPLVIWHRRRSGGSRR